MEKLSLDETWVQCLKMWKWITQPAFAEIAVYELKGRWLKQHGFSDVNAACLFCEYVGYNGGIACPGRLVDKEFNCRDIKYSFRWHRAKFLKELLRLSKIRLSKGSNMKDRKKLEKTVKDLQTAITKTQKELKELDVTYSVGDRFLNACNNKCVMVDVAGKVGLITLGDGREYGAGFVSVQNYSRVTSKEFLSMGCGFEDVTRYWDARKGVKVGCQERSKSMNTRNKLEKTVEDLQSKLTKTQQEIAELDEPKPKHGDYGTRPENTYFVCIQSNIRGKLEYANECGLVEGCELIRPLILGNIFDDLKRNQSVKCEGLREFTVDSSIYDNSISFGFSAQKEHPIWLTMRLGDNSHVMHVTSAGATEIYQKLGQVIAILKRQNANT